MHQEPLLAFAFKPIHSLNIVGSAEGRSYQCLGFTSCEHRRTMRSRKDAGFDPDVADRIELAFVRTLAFVQDLITEDLLL